MFITAVYAMPYNATTSYGLSNCVYPCKLLILFEKTWGVQELMEYKLH